MIHFSFSKIKIFFVLGISLFLSFFLKKELFIQNTPYLKMPLDQYLSSKINSVLFSLRYGDSYRNLIENPVEISERTKKNIEEVVNLPLQKISQGVYAQQKENVVKITIKEEEIEWIDQEVTIDGKKIKIRVPRDQNLSEEKIRRIFFDY
ncbi:MAG: hypothetical protein NZL96_03690 [Patescibacteria group bacterium]|nr:hypothetical protein [Patescibacteria group bacterium]